MHLLTRSQFQITIIFTKLQLQPMMTCMSHMKKTPVRGRRCQFVLSDSCFHSSYPVLNKPKTSDFLSSTKYIRLKYRRKLTYIGVIWLKTWMQVPQGKFSMLHAEPLKPILHSLSTASQLHHFKYHFAPCHICTIL